MGINPPSLILSGLMKIIAILTFYEIVIETGFLSIGGKSI
jgi:hypothetical protein